MKEFTIIVEKVNYYTVLADNKEEALTKPIPELKEPQPLRRVVAWRNISDAEYRTAFIPRTQSH